MKLLVRLPIAALADVFTGVCNAFAALGALTETWALVYVAELLSLIPNALAFLMLNPSSPLKIGKPKGKDLAKAKKRFMITLLLKLLPTGALPIYTINELAT